MGFRVPTFNISVNLWRRPAVVTGVPTSTFNANLSPGKRVIALSPAASYASLGNMVPMELLVPKGTDIAGILTNVYTDCVEVPAGSGRYYYVWHVDDTAKGFANEYRMALLLMYNDYSKAIFTNAQLMTYWPTPIP